MNQPIDIKFLLKLLNDNKERINSDGSMRSIMDLIKYSNELDEKLKIKPTPMFKGGKVDRIAAGIKFNKIPETVIHNGNTYCLREMIQQLIDEVKHLENLLANKNQP